MIEVVLAIPGSIKNKVVCFFFVGKWLKDGVALSSKDGCLTVCIAFCHNVDSLPLMQVTALSHNVQRIPYPIPPAGADPATYRSEEDPPPFGFTYPFMPNVMLLDEPIQVSSEPQSFFSIIASRCILKDALLFHSQQCLAFSLISTQGRLVGLQRQCLEHRGRQQCFGGPQHRQSNLPDDAHWAPGCSAKQSAAAPVSLMVCEANRRPQRFNRGDQPRHRSPRGAAGHRSGAWMDAIACLVNRRLATGWCIRII